MRTGTTFIFHFLPFREATTDEYMQWKVSRISDDYLRPTNSGLNVLAVRVSPV